MSTSNAVTITRQSRAFQHRLHRAVAPGVSYLTTLLVNVYFIEADDGSWLLVDTGLPLQGWRVRAEAEALFGGNARPSAIILTHGHFDHASNALALANEWDVPIYAHPLEMPYLTGKSDYPPQDPTVGGVLAQMSRLFPHSGFDFGSRVRELPADGSVPGLAEWCYVHTPGHTAGHISLFRERDRVLLAADALATVNQESVFTLVTLERELRWPPATFTPDWNAAHASIDKLAGLQPSVIAAGHGLPITENAALLLDRFAQTFTPPRHGRYVDQPARTDEGGVVALPPPVADPARNAIIGTVLAIAAGVVATQIAKRRR